MKKIAFNESFFKTDSEKSFYWAGLLAANSSLIDRVYILKSGKKTHRKIITISSSNEDVISDFCRDVDCIGRKIYISNKNKILKGDKPIYSIDFKSQIMFDDLGKFGITPTKTKTFQIPEWVENHKLINHFIRGYFDGRGSIYLDKNDSKVLEFKGTVNFLSSLNKIVKSNFDQNTRAKVSVRSTCGTLRYCGKNLVIKVADFMYKNASVFVKRKHDQLYT